MSEYSHEHIKTIQASPQVFETALTKQFGIKHPIILAGMANAAGSELAAAVSNAVSLTIS